LDTEDNSKELLDAGRSGFEKVLTQVAALTVDGDRFHARGPTSAGKVETWLNSRPEKIVYCHNLQYDLGNLFPNVLASFNLLFVDSRLIRAYGLGKLWLDSFNIWPMSLKKLGEAFGLKKGTLDARSEAYVFRDVEIVRAAMLFAWDFAAQFKIEKLPGTLGGLCVNVFHALNLGNIMDGDLFARRGYYGGRVEIFSNGGRGNFLYTDVNSLYPSAMLNPFPRDASPQKKPRGYGVADVTVFVPDCFIAPLPIRAFNGEILYPVGKFRGVWTYQELENAHAYGAKVLKIHRCYGSARGQKFYAPFVEKIYSRRLDAKTDAERLMLKLLLNNLYGRLALSGTVTRNHKGTLQLYSCQFPLPEFTNYLHAAYVTSYGRLTLQNYLRRIPWENLVYCDTDSVIFFNPTANPPFSVSKELGKMKLEGRASRCYTYAPKVYVFGHHAKAKGIRRKFAVDYIRHGSASIPSPYRIRECVDFLETQTGARKIPSVWRVVEKHAITVYDKKDLRETRWWPILAREFRWKVRRKKTKNKKGDS
jgi:hypothetical protein